MFLLRKLGKLLRGNATAFQIISACMLGFIMAFAVSPEKAPGFYLLMFFLVLILNCNLILFGLSLIMGHTLSLILTPLTFKLGVILLNSPLGELLGFLISAPVTAWMGFEYYLMPGAWVLGGIFGLIVGVGITRMLKGYINTMANLEAGSEKFGKVVNNPFFKLFAFVFLGGLSGKQTFNELRDSDHKSSPIRLIGVVAVVLGILTAFLSANMFDTAFFTTRAREVLTDLNGASVDIERISVNAFSGSVEVNKVAAANPDDLSRNRLSALRITADVDTMGLLSKRIVLNELAIVDVIADGERSTTGWIETPEPPSEEEARPLIPTDINQEQVLALIELWKLRLEGAQKAWEQVQEHFPKSDEPAPTVEEVETWQDVLERDIERLGYRAVVAKHLLPERPSFEIEKIVVDGIRAGDDPLTVFDIELAHVSSDVTLQESSPTGAIASRSGQIKIGFEGHQLRNETEANVISFQASEIPLALVQRWLPENVRPYVKNGVFSLSGKGALTQDSMEIPLSLTFEELTFEIPKVGPWTLNELTIPGNISGSPTQPAFSLDQRALAQMAENAIKDAAQDAIEGRLMDEVEKRAGDLLKDEKIGNALKGLFGN